MIRRVALAVILGVMIGLAVMATSVAAQSGAVHTGTAASSDVVAVVLADEFAAGVDDGVLGRSDTVTTAPLLAVYIGLSVLGATLALITSRRRALTVRRIELATGVAAQRRRADFWDLPAERAELVSARRGFVRPRLAGRPSLALLLGSGGTMSISEHRPKIRAGYARGPIDG